jgi:branched-chain amino acid transport system ATP-binding protein
MPLLTVEALNVFYGDLQVVSGLSMTLHEGQTVAVIGANGAGKSTLLNALSGIHREKEGRVMFDGIDITRARADQIARAGMTMVPEGRRLFGSLTVEENLLIGQAAGRIGPWDLGGIYELFPRLRDLRRLTASKLSGGQQQMAAMGRALMSNPRILLCDEISLGLAPSVILDIYRCFDRIRARGVSVVVVEQNVRQALSAAQYAYCLLEGRISREGPTETLDRESVTAAYFGSGKVA